MPKTCKVTEKMTAYFCDLKTIILLKEVYTEGAPGSDAQYIKFRMLMKEEENGVSFNAKYYIFWKKFSMIKSIVESKTLEKTLLSY